MLRPIFLAFSFFLLTACSVEEAAQKILPDEIELKSSEAVDAIMAQDSSYFMSLRPDDKSEDEFRAIIENILSYRSEGAEVARFLVGAQNNVSVSTESGKTRAISATYEVKTDGGYTLIQLGYGSQDAPCCDLASVRVQAFESSPQYKPMQRMFTALKLIGGGLVLAVLLGGLIFWRSRTKKGEA